MDFWFEETQRPDDAVYLREMGTFSSLFALLMLRCPSALFGLDAKY
jgi:hypothetical protein